MKETHQKNELYKSWEWNREKFKDNIQESRYYKYK